jgi:hypothetical protein
MPIYRVTYLTDPTEQWSDGVEAVLQNDDHGNVVEAENPEAALKLLSKRRGDVVDGEVYRIQEVVSEALVKAHVKTRSVRTVKVERYVPEPEND